MRNQISIARRVSIACELRRVPTDHVRAIAADEALDGSLKFKDGSCGKFVVEVSANNRRVMRFEELR